MKSSTKEKSIRISQLFDSQWHLVHLGWELWAGEGIFWFVNIPTLGPKRGMGFA